MKHVFSNTHTDTKTDNELLTQLSGVSVFNCSGQQRRFMEMEVPPCRLIDITSEQRQLIVGFNV